MELVSDILIVIVALLHFYPLPRNVLMGQAARDEVLSHDGGICKTIQVSRHESGIV